MSVDGAKWETSTDGSAALYFVHKDKVLAEAKRSMAGGSWVWTAFNDHGAYAGGGCDHMHSAIEMAEKMIEMFAGFAGGR